MWQDKYISQWILENISEKYEFTGQIAKILSIICELGILWIALMLAIMIYHYIKNKRITFYFVIAMIFILAMWLFCDKYLKYCNMRPRPYQEIEGFVTLMDNLGYAHPKGYSYPSGHSVVAFASAVVISKYNKKLTPYAFVLAFLVGFSRLILGAHYLSDVMSGAGFGICAGVVGALCGEKANSLLENKIYRTVKENEIR